MDRNDPICEIVARKIIEVAAGGAAIAELVFQQLGPGSSPIDE